MNIIRLRIMAVLIDLGLIIIAALLFHEIISSFLASRPEAFSGNAALMSEPMRAISTLLGVQLAYGLCGGALGTSPGKRLLRLDVIPVDGRSLSFVRAMMREQVRIAEVLFVFSGFFSLLNMLESRPTQTDTLFRTCVRDRRRQTGLQGLG